MISTFILAVIGGIPKKVETVVYPRSGRTVKRIYPVNSNIPEEAITVRAGLPPQEIVNQEHAMYAYWFGK